MIGGMWMPELIALAGGTALVTRPGDHAPTLTRDALAALAPDVVLVKPCGFPLERTLDELETLRASLPWNQWAAVRAGRVMSRTATRTSIVRGRGWSSRWRSWRPASTPRRFPTFSRSTAAAWFTFSPTCAASPGESAEALLSISPGRAPRSTQRR